MPYIYGRCRAVKQAEGALQDGGLALPLGVAAVVLARDVVVVRLQARGGDHLLVARGRHRLLEPGVAGEGILGVALRGVAAGQGGTRSGQDGDTSRALCVTPPSGATQGTCRCACRMAERKGAGDLLSVVDLLEGPEHPAHKEDPLSATPAPSFQKPQHHPASDARRGPRAHPNARMEHHTITSRQPRNRSGPFFGWEAGRSGNRQPDFVEKISSRMWLFAMPNGSNSGIDFHGQIDRQI
mmetsp:Transcript_1381/g.3185  ORF Transcript_1381/g.3185 Transcript_1381/m.3185 type:complete len:240 (+) Transcript_1381:117-836(+)|eukprot:CAMPEP_0180269784 /NCGR_PEP_ID=MMETSP0988-20121125/2839_1 /TAXON_ID=697907 /ORGANISM="non described non described, Strain CCMP2293" /LENGTH=239 /DNA_ID=CAMNT_0022240697 /DNA_START=366 /DNA_END=1085 /DNA_ORIENTATION=+